MQKKITWIVLFAGLFLTGYLVVKGTSGASSAKLSGVPAQSTFAAPVGGISGN